MKNRANVVKPFIKAKDAIGLLGWRVIVITTLTVFGNEKKSYPQECNLLLAFLLANMCIIIITVFFFLYRI